MMSMVNIAICANNINKNNYRPNNPISFIYFTILYFVQMTMILHLKCHEDLAVTLQLNGTITC